MTKLLFSCLGVKYGSFCTHGIPIVNLPRNQEDGYIRIGKNFQMNNDLSYNQIGFGKNPCVIKAFKGSITIGDNVGISHTSLIAFYADIVIGNNSLIGSGTKIYTTDFHPQNYLDRRDTSLNDVSVKSSSVIIGHDSFIGAGTIILKGVVIGDRTIIGAGSVVTKSIPSDCIAAGNPCAIVKQI